MHWKFSPLHHRRQPLAPGSDSRRPRTLYDCPGMTTPKIPRRNQRRPAASAVVTQQAGEAADATLERLHAQSRKLLAAARQKVQRAVNDTMVQTCWEVGRLIVEAEQSGEARAASGQRALPLLAERLTAEFGGSCSAQRLSAYRHFYLSFPNLSTAWRELSWSHYQLLMQVPDEVARKWYAYEAASQGWSVRALDHQIGTQYHARLQSSTDKAATQAEAVARISEQAPPHPRDFMRDPYVLEFLGATPDAALHGREVQQCLLEQLQKFLLEPGTGFAFVARQQHLRVEDADCFIGLVFYHCVLKCFMLVDLEVDPAVRQDAGQMDRCLRAFDPRQRQPDDHPSLGLVLRSERNGALARYVQPADGDPVFASRCRSLLPTESTLVAELERCRALIEATRTGGTA